MMRKTIARLAVVSAATSAGYAPRIGGETLPNANRFNRAECRVLVTKTRGLALVVDAGNR
jgi:hypothetical protein